VDLLGWVPFVALLALDVSFHHGAGLFGALRVLRIIRLLKIEKLTMSLYVLQQIVMRNFEILLMILIFELMFW
jgi:hypothetical protein